MEFQMMINISLCVGYVMVGAVGWALLEDVIDVKKHF